MSKVAVFSNKFSPAHVQHLKAYYMSFIELGYDCTLVLDDKYEGWFEEKYSIIYKRDWLNNKNQRVDIVWIYNISKIDKMMIKRIENYKIIKKFIVIHEPWCGIKNTLLNLLSHKEPMREIINSIGRKFYLSKLLKDKFEVVVCSKNAKTLYDKFHKKNKAHQFSLIFIDELKGKINIDDKKYFSFIGTANVAHGFDDYIEYIKQHKDLFCQIVTSTNIEKFIDFELQKMIDDGHLIVKHGNYLSDVDMNKAYQTANILWLKYKRSTQSGCLCKAFMFGTPVICSRIGSFEEYVNDDNGVFVDEKNLISFSHLMGEKVYLSCRTAYLNFFDYKNKLLNLKKIIRMGD